MKEKEGEVLKSNPQLMEVKERLDSLEKTVKEIVMESKFQRSVKVEGEIPQKKMADEKKERNGGDNININQNVAKSGGNEK